MARYFIVSRPGGATEVSLKDLEEFRNWLGRDLAYLRKRSKKFRLANPTRKDANIGAIREKSRLLQLVRAVLGERTTRVPTRGFKNEG